MANSKTKPNKENQTKDPVKTQDYSTYSEMYANTDAKGRETGITIALTPEKIDDTRQRKMYKVNFYYVMRREIKLPAAAEMLISENQAQDLYKILYKINETFKQHNHDVNYEANNEMDIEERIL